MTNFFDFIDDLSALLSRQPMNEIEAILWLNSLQYNCVMAAERIQREELNRQNFGGTH